MSALLCLLLIGSACSFTIIRNTTDKNEEASGRTLEDEDLGISALLEKANRNLGKDLADPLVVERDIALQDGLQNADPCTARGKCMWIKTYDGKVYVPYRISNQYLKSEKTTIETALRAFTRSTCIRFIPQTKSHKDFVDIQSLKGCYSYVGRQGGAQDVSLDRNGCLFTSTIQHEMLHALGYDHEHSRSDRDKHVRILMANVVPRERHNFDLVQTNNLGTPYDYNSVMQYGRDFFSRNGKDTIVPIPNPKVIIGKATKMSANDILRVNLLYQCSFYCGVTQRQLQFILQQRSQSIFEGIPKAGNPISLNQIYTELYVTEGGAAGTCEEHEVRRIEGASRKWAGPETIIACEDIFKVHPKTDGGFSTELTSEVDQQTQVRTVLTMGVAGIGKTVLTQKFCLDWAEGKANRDIYLLFPFTFRELNVLRDKQISLVGLVQHFFTKLIKLSSSQKVQIVFIFDGLDECRFSLDFAQSLTDPTEPSSVGVLLVNLIKGSLLPSARIWITTRPAAANQIPAECVSMVTEVRGFTDPQKEQYFRKRFSKEQEAKAVISHIKKSRSLYAMCRIPVFSWITSTVLEHVMKTGATNQLPKTLTEMYIYFLVVQAKCKGLKYDGKSETDPVWSSENCKMVMSLGKLAFEQLQKGNLIFYESDLVECGLDVSKASMYSGVFTQVFREESGLYRDKVYSFVHLSVQEFLAALHVHATFVKTEMNLLKTQGLMDSLKILLKRKQHLYQLHQTAVDEALKNPNGKWDLFLRFLLGLSHRTNEKLLLDVLNKHDSFSSEALVDQSTVEYIHKKLKRHSPEESINLFYCLNELGDHSLVGKVQQLLKDGNLSSSTSPELWSAVVFTLLSSDNDLRVFDLKKYCASEEAFLRLLPVVKEATIATLTYCNLSSVSCNLLSSVLSSQLSSIRHLDISNNDLCDAGVGQLCLGLKSPECRLESLRLSGCVVSEKGGASLASALSSPSSCVKDLDLSYNHPQVATIEILTALQQDPHHSLSTLRVEPAGKRWLTPGLRKYFCELTLDLNSAHRRLELLNTRTVTLREKEQPYPDHPHRFDSCQQVLCSTGLSGRCYWEVDWRGKWTNWEVDIAVSYRAMGRTGGSEFGRSDRSWCLKISSGGYSVLHGGKQTPISSSYLSTDQVAVYLDYAAGTLTFYKIDSNNDGKLVHLHTFTTTFTEPLYAGFGFGVWSSGVSVSFDKLLL